MVHNEINGVRGEDIVPLSKPHPQVLILDCRTVAPLSAASVFHRLQDCKLLRITKIFFNFGAKFNALTMETNQNMPSVDLSATDDSAIASATQSDTRHDDAIAARLDRIEQMLQQSITKDETIQRLHDDMSRMRDNMIAELRSTLLQAIFKIDARVKQLQSDNSATIVLDSPEYDRLMQQVQYLSDFVTDILTEDFCVKAIIPQALEPFDRSKHFCIQTVNTDDATLEGKIASVVSPGYHSSQGGKILRQATVTVYKLSKS